MDQPITAAARPTMLVRRILIAAWFAAAAAMLASPFLFEPAACDAAFGQCD